MSSQQKLRTLFGPAQVREQPNVMLGSTGLPGAQQCFLEIVANSLDEASSGYGDVIEVDVAEDGTVSIRDFGRGVPMDWDDTIENEDGSFGAWAWDRVFNTLYSSGKYDDSELNQELLNISDWGKFDASRYPYLYSVGTHGVGATATQFASAEFQATSYSGTEALTVSFREGFPVGGVDEALVRSASNEPRGTLVSYRPDPTVFTDVNVPVSWYRSLCEGFALISGVTFKFSSPDSQEVFEGSDLKTYCDTNFPNNDGSHTFHHTVGYHKNQDWVLLCDVESYIIPTAEFQHDNRYYNNLLAVRGGVHDEAFYQAIGEFFQGYLSQRGIKPVPDDYAMALSSVIATKSNVVDYRGQTKDSLDNRHVYEAILDTLRTQLDALYANRVDWFMAVLDEVVKRASDRVNRVASVKEIREVKKATRSNELPSNFVSCLEYQAGRYHNVEIFLAEGESALGSICLGRDGNTQAILPLRGKGLNVYKASISKALANKEIMNILQVLGCGMETGDSSTFNINKLRCDKVIFASDADVDGFHIRNLLFLVFYKFFPQLLIEGKVFIAETPRYGIVRNGYTEYCRDNEALEASLKDNSNYSQIKRFKGLGEVDPAVLSETTLHPDTRNLIPLTINEDDMELVRALEVMYGQDTDARKRLLLDMINADKGGSDRFAQRLRDFTQKETNARTDAELEVIWL